MSKLLALLCVCLYATAAFAQNGLAIRERILPLYSDKETVRRIAQPNNDIPNHERFETPNEILDISFSGAPCVGSGWNVPSGKVVTYISYPKRPVLLADVLRLKFNFVEIADDTGSRIFTDAVNGVGLVVALGSQRIDHFRFFPSAPDRKLRCNGFPQYNPVADNYSPYQVERIPKPSLWDPGRIFPTVSRLKGNAQLKGFVFVYCPKARLKSCEDVKKKIEKVVNIELRNGIERITIMNGGFRSSTEVESFLVPKEYPDAAARPNY